MWVYEHQVIALPIYRQETLWNHELTWLTHSLKPYERKSQDPQWLSPYTMFKCCTETCSQSRLGYIFSPHWCPKATESLDPFLGVFILCTWKLKFPLTFWTRSSISLNEKKVSCRTAEDGGLRQVKLRFQFGNKHETRIQVSPLSLWNALKGQWTSCSLFLQMWLWLKRLALLTGEIKRSLNFDRWDYIHFIYFSHSTVKWKVVCSDARQMHLDWRQEQNGRLNVQSCQS